MSSEDPRELLLPRWFVPACVGASWYLYGLAFLPGFSSLVEQVVDIVLIFIVIYRVKNCIFRAMLLDSLLQHVYFLDDLKRDQAKISWISEHKIWNHVGIDFRYEHNDPFAIFRLILFYIGQKDNTAMHNDFFNVPHVERHLMLTELKNGIA